MLGVSPAKDPTSALSLEDFFPQSALSAVAKNRFPKFAVNYGPKAHNLSMAYFIQGTTVIPGALHSVGDVPGPYRRIANPPPPPMPFVDNKTT